MSASPLKKILLVDDSRFMLEIMGKAFKNQGFTCFKAESVEQGLQILQGIVPDIILSDYEMPKLNGFDFRKLLIESPQLKNIPFVFLTSHTDKKTMMKGLDLQAVDYINKDTPISVVVSKINNILYTLRVQHERSIQELRTAAEALNLISIPQDAPNVPGFSINFWHQSYQNYPGGDFIDFIKIDDQFTFIVLGDVMGKKWGAWFFSFNFLSYIRSAVRLCVYDGEFTTSTILQKINQIICLDSVLSDVLSTLSLVMINHKENKVAYAGAGDLPLIYYNKKSNKITPLRSTGLILGLFQEGLYTEEVLEISSGDQLLIISDGMTDFQDNNGKMSDFTLFLKNIHNYMGHEDTFTLLKQNVCFTDPTKEQVDDCSLIFIQKV